MSNLNNEVLDLSKKFLGQEVVIKIDRPMNSKHPQHGFKYELNYGFVPNTKVPDGEEIDAYVLGIKKPVKKFKGICQAIIYRYDDPDHKLIITLRGYKITDEEIKKTNFQEKYFKSEVIR